jgi:hypothetical protein
MDDYKDCEHGVAKSLPCEKCSTGAFIDRLQQGIRSLIKAGDAMAVDIAITKDLRDAWRKAKEPLRNMK